MRTLLPAVAASLLVTAPAAADYRRLPGPPVESITLGGGELFVVAQNTLTAHRPDGRRRTIALPKTSSRLDYVTASSDGIALSMFPRRSFYRTADKGWKRVKDQYANVQVQGRWMSVLREHRYEERRSSVELVDLRSGASRRFGLRGLNVVGVSVAGRYFAHYVNFAVGSRETLVVRSLRTGREVYRVVPGNATSYALLPGGRLVVVSPTRIGFRYRISVATPGRPKLRRLRETGLGNGGIAATGDAIAIVRGDPRARSEVALLGWDGRVRPITPLLETVENLEFDGRTVAFTVGDCAFMGPVPTGAPPPVDTTGCVRSADAGSGG